MSYTANDSFWTQRVAKEEKRIFRDLQTRMELETLRDVGRLTSLATYHGNSPRRTGQGLSQTIKYLETVLIREKIRNKRAQDKVKKLTKILKELEE